ncbi:uncharacterized protein LOC109848699 [Asparagus officinalis]|uniref:uncharacterized protein LOC109848699 n=1 Tax=Asparagus officinalis TaxID=4686 RepID=UPI00098E7E76|nr:uncharacterized protein LOC109848699 [Asparagus officinalis]
MITSQHCLRNYLKNMFFNLSLLNLCCTLLLRMQVNPSLYGDNNTHLFINWTIDGFRNTGCYDHLCPGFVQVNPRIHLGATLGPLSVYDGIQYAIRLLVFKDPTTGDWWLAFGKNKEAVGYWPKSLFNTLNDHATKVYRGGLVKSPINEPSAPMGSGHFAAEGLRRACYSADLYLVDGSNGYMHIPEDEVEFRHSDPGCYRTTRYLTNMNFGSQGFLFGGLAIVH